MQTRCRLPRRAMLAGLLALAALAAAGPATATDTTSDPRALAALERAEAALSPPVTFSTPEAAIAGREATHALRELALLMPGLRGEDRAAARLLLRRPDPGAGAPEPLFVRESDDSPICDPDFCVHWAGWGRDAPSSSQFVDQVVKSMRRSVSVQNDQLGWRRAKSDGDRGSKDGVGAEGQVDVYIMELGRALYGYAAPDPGQRGMRRYGYLVLDNDYVGFRSTPVEAMQATVAHEYNHILQFGYDSFQDLWLFEATAVWMEERVYPELDDYLGYLRYFATRTQVPMTGEGMKIYGLGVWNHWLAKRYGEDLIRQVWEVSPSSRHFAIESYERALAQQGGGSFAREFASFAAAGAEWAAADAFPDAARYPPIERRRTIRRTGDGGRLVLDNTAYALLDIDVGRRKNLKLSLRTRRGVRAAVALVGRTGGVATGRVARSITHLPRGGRGTVRLGNARRFDRVTAVIVNADGRSDGWGKGDKRLYRSDHTGFRYRLVR